MKRVNYTMPLYIDGHLDLASNVTAAGRDLRLTVEALRLQEAKSRQELLVSLPELQQAGVGIVFATLFTMPRRAPGADSLPEAQSYHTPAEASALASEQLDVYERWEEEGWVRILRFRADLERHLDAWEKGDKTTALVILMEGADPILSPEALSLWVARGLRLLGPAWQRTRYCGGTQAPGPLSELGVELIHAMNHHKLALDLSHMAEESFWQALELAPQYVFASHANARALTPTDRHLSDAMIRAIGGRDGVVGLVLGNPFIKAGVTRDHPKESVTLEDVRAQAEHVAALIGWDKVAIGSDFDGGFGVQETPLEIRRGADFAKLGSAAPEEARAGFLGENWLRFLTRVLPPARD